MKKTFSLISFVLSVVVAVCDLCLAVFGMIDLQKTLNILSTTPGTSGIDYFGIAWGLAILLFFVSLVGLTFSTTTVLIAEKLIIKRSACTICILFALLLMVSVFIFFI
ncbi:MAG: hypothetical protein IKU82_06555 [Clostridia bacterium]|nr:hypothetical protein [Clostridia bacterium]